MNRPRLAYVCTLGLLLAGCAGYQIGAATLYPPDVRTVAVPMFESTSFRRNLGERLTEAVQKQIELKTPYKVVSGIRADSVLWGRLISDTKRVTAETPTDEPREVELNLRVEIRWTDRRGALLREDSLPLPPNVALIAQSARVVPEVGHSIATGQQQAINRLAEQIVSLMENPW